MKRVHYSLLIKIFFLQLFFCVRLSGQECTFSAPIIKLDFGNSQQPPGVNLSFLKNYKDESQNCPNDGSYAFTASTRDCFTGHWHPLTQDHTPGDVEGRMLVVNSSYPTGTCFMVTIDGLKSNTTYQFGTWLANLCDPDADCTELNPNLLFVIADELGKEFSKFSTGEIGMTPTLTWLQHSGIFTTPAATGKLVLKIINQAEGGCGNDFAMDDITLQECVFPKQTKPAPLVQKQQKPGVKTIPKPVGQPATIPVQDQTSTLTRLPVANTPVAKTVARPGSGIVPIPAVILSRENPVIKKITTGAEELLIELYDNGEIDGDSVSIYHNNKLIISHAGLSAKPISFHLTIDAGHPYHELVMVAHNLGSIPPNTSVMIITTRNRRHEIFISSSEQKNAKILLELQQ